MTNNKKVIKLISPKSLDERFNFVGDTTLRRNLSNTFSFIIFLDSIENELHLPDLYKAFIYKTSIIYSTSIIESLLHYKLKTLLDQEETSNKELFRTKYKYIDKSMIKPDLDINVTLAVCKKIEDQQELKPNTQFHDMIIAGKRCGLLTDTLFKHCNDIKDLRNNIHMASMTEIDDKYSRELVDDVFDKVKKVIRRIEKYKPI